jgi:hypothetical protein
VGIDIASSRVADRPAPLKYVYRESIVVTGEREAETSFVGSFGIVRTKMSRIPIT